MIAVFLLLLFLFYSGFHAVWQRIWSHRLTLELRFSEEAVYEGDQAALMEIIENRKSVPVPVLEAGFRIQKGIVFEDASNTQASDYLYKRDVFSLLGRERISRTHTLDCRKRGRYTFSQVTLVTYSLFHRHKYIREAFSDSSLYVYAKRADLAGIFPALDQILGELDSSRRLYEDPFSFSLIRPYTIQDPMKTINWKASARSMELMVNTYSSVQSHRFRILLDVSDPFIVKQDNLVEESIRLAATLSSRLLRQNQSVSFFCNACPQGSKSPFRLEKGRGGFAERQIEQYLTQDFSKTETSAFRDLVLEKAVPAKADSPSREPEIPLFISKNADAALYETLLAAAGRAAAAIWVIPVPSGTSLPFPQQNGLILIPREVL